jgi:uncharacterized protein (DUF697 family)
VNLIFQESTMHDIDRTQMEYGQYEQGFGQNELAFEAEQFEFGPVSETHGIFTEAQEMELAQELLSVSNEAELDQFLGNLIRKAGSAIGKAVRSPVGQAIGGMLKGVAKKALPLAGGALGAWVGGPLGAKIGSGLGSLAGNALGLEAETMQQEDREFEGARHFVRMAGDIVKRTTSTGNADPRAAAQAATMAATKQFAPGLLNPAAAAAADAASSAPGGNSGRWVRKGNQVILYGL